MCIYAVLFSSNAQTLSNSLDSRLASRLWTGEMT